MKRDLIREIREMCQRQSYDADRTRAFGERYNSLVFALIALDTWNTPAQTSIRSEFFRHFPSALVACVESYFRRCVRDLIDSGEPFRTNAAKLTEQKFTVETIIALHGKPVSVGTFVSHLVSLNNLDGIRNAMKTLTAEDFISRLKRTRLKTAGGLEKQTLERVQPDFYAVLERLFRTRHILCHEFGASEQLTRDIVGSYLKTTFHFVLGTEALMNELLVRQTKKPTSVPSKSAR